MTNVGVEEGWRVAEIVGGMFNIVWSFLSAASAMKPKFGEKVKLKKP
jgi:hypothetical protein